MSEYLQINNKDWKVEFFSGDKLFISPKDKSDATELHMLYRHFTKNNYKELSDFIQAPDSFTIFLHQKMELRAIKGWLNSIQFSSGHDLKPTHHSIPVCYETGEDLDEVVDFTGLEKNEIISIHSNTEYILSCRGFLPGFMYLSGLSSKLSCPRKKEPRVEVQPGSVAIGGNQTGIYGLKSPGGWNIIGKTPKSLLNPEKPEKSNYMPGDRIRFERISQTEFNNY